MAKDDYFVIVYKLLRILYEDLKSSEETDLEAVIRNTDIFPIGQRYWIAILEDLLEKNYIKGVSIVPIANSDKRTIKQKKSGVRITADGVEYLENNSTMQKMKNVIGVVKDFMPFAGLFGA